MRHRTLIHEVDKRTRLCNVSPLLDHRHKWRDFCQTLWVEITRTIVNSVLGHPIKTTVENAAAKHSGGPFSSFFFLPEPSVLVPWRRRAARLSDRSLEGDETRGTETYSARGLYHIITAWG